MKGQEHHRQFAIKCFAQFMTRSQITNAFIEELQDELPNPLTNLRNLSPELKAKYHCRVLLSLYLNFVNMV